METRNTRSLPRAGSSVPAVGPDQQVELTWIEKLIEFVDGRLEEEWRCQWPRGKAA